MKKLKIYKSALALTTATSFLLMSGCSSSEGIIKDDSNTCTHLTVHFEKGPVTFKECEGYDMTISKKGKTEIKYDISKNDEEVVSGTTTKDNMLEVYHDTFSTVLDIGLVKKYK